MLSTGVTGGSRRPARQSDPGIGAHALRFPGANRVRGFGPLPRGVPVFHTSDQGDCFMQQKTEALDPLETDPALSAEIPPDHRNEVVLAGRITAVPVRSEEHTSELQSRFDLVCRLLLEKKKKT